MCVCDCVCARLCVCVCVCVCVCETVLTEFADGVRDKERGMWAERRAREGEVFFSFAHGRLNWWDNYASLLA